VGGWFQARSCLKTKPKMLPWPDLWVLPEGTALTSVSPLTVPCGRHKLWGAVGIPQG
jgi:hypothetical protein